MSAADLCQFHITAQCSEGGYKLNVKAANPLLAIAKAIKKMGLDQMPTDPFLITIEPKRKPAR
jgi:hypothetical protein